MDTAQHQAEILDQFTRQADPFLQRHAHSNEALLALMAQCVTPRPDDALLDIACGPGIVSCFFAPRVRRVTGLDLVPGMLDRARRLQAERGIENIDWQLGECTKLPFSGSSFDCVVTRFSFHHFLDPLAALREMKRVAKPGGTILVTDVSPSPETQARFNEWEILRDPSHTLALTAAEFRGLGEEAGLSLHCEESFALEMELDDLLKGSFPKPGNADRIRALFDDDIRADRNALGLMPRREQGTIHITYPVAVFAWNA